jgi:hypothetical protein
MTSPSASESESRQIEAIERDIDRIRTEQAAIGSRVQDLLRREDPERGVTFHEEIFRLQQDKLRMDTEIQFLQVKLRRITSTW